MKRMTCLRIAILGWPTALLMTLTTAPFAVAVDIPIVNAGFEDNPVAMGCFAVFTPNGWNIFDPGGIQGGGDVVGGLHPAGGPYFPAAPEGDHVAIVFLQGDVGGSPMGLSQSLGETLQPNQRYTLSVEIGDIASGTGPPPCDVFGFFDLDGFPGYQVQLLAGGGIIAQDENSLAPLLDDGVFMETTIEVVIDDEHPLLGQQLEIRLINLNMIDTPEHPGIEVDFDNVRLTRECANGGDIDNDTLIDASDVTIFVDVLLGNDTDAAHVARSDLDCSGDVNGLDVAVMVARLLE
ncbi:MAG TPA: hypothetical protein P5081_08485 [Phycisphaerae bacterium]|nr:hypothetical protein [Phycisphaerae bacterium]HRW52910.1 hypothetical protein [Phycisphaerae bacterium]